MAQLFDAAPPDRATWRVTTAVLVFLLVVVPALSVIDGSGSGGVLTGAVIGLGVVGVAWGFSPAGYEVDGDLLRVRRRLFGARAFRVDGAVERAAWHVGFGNIRIGGSGGLFGWFGRFWRPDVGRYHAYLTDRGRIVRCATSTGPVLVSPADPDAFITAAHEELRR